MNLSVETRLNEASNLFFFSTIILEFSQWHKLTDKTADQLAESLDRTFRANLDNINKFILNYNFRFVMKNKIVFNKIWNRRFVCRGAQVKSRLIGRDRALPLLISDKVLFVVIGSKNCFEYFFKGTMIDLSSSICYTKKKYGRCSDTTTNKM